MQLVFFYHRYANLLVENDPNFQSDYNELISVINSISEQDLIEMFNQRKTERKNIKSLSEPVNNLLKFRLTELGWKSESSLFKEPPYNQGNRSRWRLDFAKNKISIEVAFNHQEATAHNIMKPVLASELNHVKKDIQTRMGIIIVATEKMKKAGNFDSAIGTFEKFQEYFKPYNNLITVPIVLIGLCAPKTFKIDKKSKEIISF
ncbi:MAG: hypothetical protein CMP49_00270 [Flavobacteriales bacterium]|jgi:hypothetical protein|nr:hypothetical protein [Flavobacteriales bacterium]|tara:strand:+ start:36 stop:647 length:612 start_codon:yes stop_codon:yes gene_type:complete